MPGDQLPDPSPRKVREGVVTARQDGDAYPDPNKTAG